MQHDTWAIIIPTLTIVLAALFNRSDTSKTRTEVNESLEAFRAEMRGNFARVDAQLATHTEQFSALRERLARLEKRLRISA